jgi:hypothetical protein
MCEGGGCGEVNVYFLKAMLAYENKLKAMTPSHSTILQD